MLTPEERAVVTEIQDRLIELFVLQDEASKAEDRAQIQRLQSEIDDLLIERDRVRQMNTAGSR